MFGFEAAGGRHASDLDQRRRALIQKIRSCTTIPEDEKRFLIQNVMCGQIDSSMDIFKDNMNGPTGKPSPVPLVGGNMFSSPSPSSFVSSPHTMTPTIVVSGVPPRARPEDLVPTFFDASSKRLGCEHYERSCKKLAPCCQRYFTCRKCHDECSDHSMNRFAVRQIMCMRCGTEQPPGAHCISEKCARAPPFARTFCSDCVLYTSDWPVFHCPKCGVCRKGRGLGIDYRHCDTCQVCLQVDQFDKHRCVENSHAANCPICHDSLSPKLSTLVVCVPLCGHPMHEQCMQNYIRHGSYRCPLCMQALGDMSSEWVQMKRLVDEQPMPDAYKEAKARVSCVACGNTSVVPYHFLGHQCQTCMSFNTQIEATMNMPDETHEDDDDNYNFDDDDDDDENDQSDDRMDISSEE